ncbi:MAG: replication restart helicase PriA [Erysipelotrichaceae bacterium]
MIVAQVLIQHATHQLDKTFTYAVDGFCVEVGMRVEVEFRNRRILGMVMALETLEQPPAYSIKSIVDVVDEQAVLPDEFFELGRWMAARTVSPLMACYQAMLPPVLKAKKNNHRIKQVEMLRYVQEVETKSGKQKAALLYLKQVQTIEKKEFIKQFKTSGQALIRMGAAQLYYEEYKAILQNDALHPKQVLREDQQNAYDAIIRYDGVSLLHGVTGSGKTEVFLQLAQAILEQNQQVIVLVPEIALTAQMIERVKGRFGKRVAIYHSHLSAQEKYEQFQLVKQGEVQIVVGTRSAIFMPFERLGLIVVDEEHDGSYKQDVNPRYHAIEVAKWRATRHHAKVVLASATPSIESYARAIKKVYQLVELPTRINETMPRVEVVSMLDELKQGGEYGLSKLLLQRMQETLQRKEQVILLLNRRGYAAQKRCLDCGYIPTCPRCELTLTYHNSDEGLHCHYCDYETPSLHVCPQCQGRHFSFVGVGTQRLVERLQDHFPTHSIMRMDYDTTRGKGAHDALLTRFSNHEADILVGTQMIAKGLDFANVTLVGIVNADDGLHRPSYQAGFQTFSLLVQAAGRSGRGQKAGNVVVQAFAPNQYSIQAAIQANYRRFFQEEMRFRHLASYPPYVYLATLSLSHAQKELVEQEMALLKQKVQAPSLVKIIGPSEPIKRNNRYLTRLVLKSKQEDALIATCQKLVEWHVSNKQRASIDVNINPFDVE